MKNYLVKPHKKFHLSHFDPQDTCLSTKEQADRDCDERRHAMRQLQQLLYAEHKHKVLIVLQGMDTSGKDSTIRFVFQNVNPQSVRVASFGVPTQIELEHDYLWRIHQQAPRAGEIVIFNRSHYEDVLTVRVHDLVPRKIWQGRFRHINEFERLLAEEGTLILKFFLHISRDEQKKRLEERLQDPQKQWKFKEGDLKERKKWHNYMKAYSDVMALTSTPWAPWFVVPADTKWYRNWVITGVIVEAMQKLRMQYPKLEPKLHSVRIQ